MKRFAISTACCSLLIVLLATAASAEPVTVKGTRVVVDRPAGFSDAPNFSGLVEPAAKASIMVSELPAPYALTTAGFDEAHMKERGWTFISKEPIQVGAYPGVLLHFTQPAAGEVFRKWINAFGDDKKTVLVTAAFPDDASAKLSEPMKKAALSARYDDAAPVPSLTADLPFTVTGTAQLKLAGRIQNALAFTPSGKMANAGHSDGTVFIVAQAINDLDIGDKAVYARRRLHQTTLTDIKIISEADVNIASMPGREILATAIDKGGDKVFVMHTMLYGLGSYFIMQGITQESQREKMEPAFRALAKSFRIK